MAYDPEVAERIRETLDEDPDVASKLDERRMFGGLAFMVDDKMTVTAMSRGGMMLRVGAERADELIDAGLVEQMIMNGRSMTGWVYTSDPMTFDNATFERLVGDALEFTSAVK